LLCLLFIFSEGSGQVCTGSLGDPVVNIDFGRGDAQIGPPFASSNYNYVTDSPQDGSYTIARSTIGMNSGWYDLYNHTPGDSFGYMMVVNANWDPGIFYESNIPIDLCPNTTYEFAAWAVNMLKYSGVKPNITFMIVDINDQVLGRYDTGDIPDTDPTWKQYGFLFRTTGGGQVRIRMVSNVTNTTGGGGNDIAIDDITFRPCGPLITSSIDGTGTQVIDVCENQNASIVLRANVEGSATLKYQWQTQTETGWADVPGANSDTLPVTFTPGSKPGAYNYRLSAAEPGNFNSPSCRTVSPVMTINVTPLPVPKALSNEPVCLGESLILDVADATGSYEWRKDGGPVFSTEKSPVISNVTAAMEGTYTVTIKGGGCETSASVVVHTVPPPVPAVANPAPEICLGDSVMLQASGGDFYSWSPSAGLSGSGIANPVASPSETTLYTVKVYSGTCYKETQVNVIVHQPPAADAGPDKKILSGYDTRLEGKVSGEGVTYFWYPTTGMDNPSSLNPLVAPKEDITYTLNALSPAGCVTAVDSVFVKVYDRLIIPNVFSPNGDGSNDTWNITAIDAFETPVVKVMNRYGEVVFESRGYDVPWDGRRKSENLPVGVYFYIIRLRGDLETLTGSVTIVR